jgi:hypothetical protein
MPLAERPLPTRKLFPIMKSRWDKKPKIRMRFPPPSLVRTVTAFDLQKFDLQEI